MSNSNESSQQLKQKAMRGVVWSVAEKGGAQATQFLTFLVLARLLSPDAFGLISLANVFIHFVQALINSGFSEAIVQRKDLEPEHLDTAFWVNLGIGTAITAVGIFAANAIAIFFKEPALTPIIQCLSLNVFIKSLADVQQAILRRKLHFRGLTVRRVVGLIAGSVVGITMALMNFGVWSLVVQTLVANLVGVILLWKISGWRPGFKVSKSHFKELFSFGINVFGISIFVFLNRRGDDFLIGYFLGPTALGYYTIAYKIFVTVMQVLQEATQKVSLPTFSKLQGDREKLLRAFYTGTRVVSFVGVPAFIGLAMVAPEFIQIAFGEQWLPSVPVMQILALNGVLVIVMSFSGPSIMAIGKPSWNFRLLFVNTVVKVPAFLIAVEYGIVWVAAALVASNYLVWPLYLWALKRLLSVKFITLFNRLAAPVVATLLMVGALAGFKLIARDFVGIQVMLTLSIILGAVVYLGAIALIAPDIFKQIFNLLKAVLPKKWLAKSKRV